MNTRLLKRVRDKILDNPTQVNMDQWYAPYNGTGQGAVEGCGTAGCVCGWALALHDKKTLAQERNFIRRKHPKTTNWQTQISTMERLGRKVLGLTKAQANRLFYSQYGDWPKDLCEKLWDADNFGTQEDYAHVVADRIDRFIKTKGEE